MLAPLVVVLTFAVAQPRTKTSDLRESADAIAERALSAAIDRTTAATSEEACSELERALFLYWQPHPEQVHEWPRVMRRALPERLKSSWRAPAAACVTERLKAAPDKSVLSSALLHDETLYEKVKVPDAGMVGRGGGAGTWPSTPITINATDAKPTLIVAGLDAELIHKVIQQNRGQIRYCYERQLFAGRKLAGVVEVEFTVTKAGSTAELIKVTSSLDDPSVEVCILTRMATWVFPRPKTTEPRARYRFNLRPLQ